MTENKDLTSPAAKDDHNEIASDEFPSLERQEPFTSAANTPLSSGCLSTHSNQETINGAHKDKKTTDNARYSTRGKELK